MKIRQAVILAGGRGERLRPVTDHVPKPMAPILGRPFADYLLQSLIDAGITKILFLLGYKAEKVVNYYGTQLAAGVQVTYSIGTPEDLTGRRLLNAYPYLDSEFLLLYGDNYWPIEIQQMTDLFACKRAVAMTTVFGNQEGTGEYGFGNNVEVSGDSLVKEYDKQRKSKTLNGVDIGYFILNKSVLNPDLLDNISFEEVILASLAKEQRLIAYVTHRQYYYITNIKNLKHFEEVVEREGFQPVHHVNSLVHQEPVLV